MIGCRCLYLEGSIPGIPIRVLSSAGKRWSVETTVWWVERGAIDTARLVDGVIAGDVDRGTQEALAKRLSLPPTGLIPIFPSHGEISLEDPILQSQI